MLKTKGGLWNKTKKLKMRLDRKRRKKETGQIWHSVYAWHSLVCLTDGEKKLSKGMNTNHTLRGQT